MEIKHKNFPVGKEVGVLLLTGYPTNYRLKRYKITSIKFDGIKNLVYLRGFIPLDYDSLINNTNYLLECKYNLLMYTPFIITPELEERCNNFIKSKYGSWDIPKEQFISFM